MMHVCNVVRIIFLTLTIFLTFCSNSFGFIPNELLGSSSPSSKFHTEMVKDALVENARQYFNAQLAPGIPKIEAVKNSDELFQRYYGPEVSANGFEDVIKKISKAAASIDSDKATKKNPVWHFDSERIEGGHEKLQGHFNNVVHLIGVEQYDAAREVLGRALHPLQDFYSHTNWVELGNKEPNYNIGIPGKGVGYRIAGPNEQTCVDCVKDFSSRLKSGLLKVSLVGFAFGAAGGDDDNIFNCEQNVIVKDALTSGYSVNQKDDEGNPVEKPKGVGKCSHGGTLDKSSGEYAKGGLNKDCENGLFAPHDYLHSTAQVYAVNASIYWLSKIQETVNNTAKWGKFLQLLPGTSVAFAFDVSPSNKGNVEKIENRVKELLAKHRADKNRPVAYYVIPFSKDIAGPIMAAATEKELTETTYYQFFEVANKEFSKNYTSPDRKFYDALNQLAQISMVTGRIYAFLNGNPSDEHLTPWLSKTLTDKQLTLNIILEKNLKHRVKRYVENWGDNLEGILADLTGGAVLAAESDEIGDALTFLDRSADGSQTTLIRKRATHNEPHSFEVDNTIYAFDVVLSTFADMPLMTLEDPSGKTITLNKQNTIRREHFYEMKVINPSKGLWTAKVHSQEGHSIGPYVLEVRANTTLRMDVSFITIDDFQDSDHPGTHYVGSRPRANSPAVVAVQMISPVPVSPLFMQLRGANWEPISQAQLVRSPRQENVFTANIEVPSDPFYFRVFGFDANGNRFIRTKAGLVQPEVVEISAARSSDSPVHATPGAPYGLDYTIHNFGETAFFDVQVTDTKGWVTATVPEGQIIFEDSDLEGKILMSIPEDASVGDVTQVSVLVRSDKFQSTTSYTDYVMVDNRAKVVIKHKRDTL